MTKKYNSVIQLLQDLDVDIDSILTDYQNNVISKLLYTSRTKQEISQEQLAGRTGYSVDTIDELENMWDDDIDKDAAYFCLNFLSKEHVVCAAIRNSEGLIITGARHYDNIMRQLIQQLGGISCWRGTNCEQGFIDQYDNFLTREEAYQIAEKNGQIKRRVGGDKDFLFSENLY